MNNTINGRTPGEIYKALRCIITQINDDCEDYYDSCKNCPNNFDGGRRELAVHLADATVRIQQLERERDAAVEQLKEVDRVDLFRCSHCIHDELCNDGLTSCIDCDKDCPCHTCKNGSNWQWSGVQEVE